MIGYRGRHIMSKRDGERWREEREMYIYRERENET